MDSKKVPEELEAALQKALHNVAIWAHETYGTVQVVVMVQHISDALAKASQTTVYMAGGGGKLEVCDGNCANHEHNKDTIKESAQVLAEDLVAQMMKAAKDKGGKTADKAANKAVDQPDTNIQGS